MSSNFRDRGSPVYDSMGAQLLNSCQQNMCIGEMVFLAFLHCFAFSWQALEKWPAASSLRPALCRSFCSRGLTCLSTATTAIHCPVRENCPSIICQITKGQADKRKEKGATRACVCVYHYHHVINNNDWAEQKPAAVNIDVSVILQGGDSTALKNCLEIRLSSSGNFCNWIATQGGFSKVYGGMSRWDGKDFSLSLSNAMEIPGQK